MKQKVILFVVNCFVLFGCSPKNMQEKHQEKRNNIISIKNKIREIPIGDALIGGFYNRPYILNDYLLISSQNSIDYFLHVYQKKNLKFLFSALPKGESPREITRLGSISVSEKTKEFYALDLGKQKIFEYNIDSLKNAPLDYIPIDRVSVNKAQFPYNFQYLEDDLSYAQTIRPTGNSGYNQLITRWDMNTGEMTPLPYVHPKIEKKRVSFWASLEHNIGIETYHHHDLMTIHHLDGELKCNIYGPKWDDKNTNKFNFYSHLASPLVVNDHIIAPSSQGKERLKENSLAEDLLVFDLDGNYVKTLHVGYQIFGLCYDEETDRLFFAFDDAVQFGYLQVGDLI